MKKIGLLLICGSLIAGIHQARATAQLRLSDGTAAGTVTVTDNDPNDADPTVGVISYSGPVGPNWTADITIGNSDGTPSAPAMDVASRDTSVSAGTLTVDFSQTDFTSGGAASLEIGGISDGTVTYQVWTDAGNANFAKTTSVGTVGPLTPDIPGDPFSGSSNAIMSSTAPFSITMETVIQHPTAGTTGLDASLIVTPPACTCTLSFTSPASITNCEGDVIPDAVATGDCGGGPTSVPVTVTGAVTNGVCPLIITRTNSATDGCGTVHTFVQTITVNCQPDCMITPSVTTATVGGSNYTASVADAGVGASYSWTVVNGAITAGQNTPQITWSAGTDTNNPITILITVTTATGCQSACSSSVRLIPKPPVVNLGSGDTATIGFWHNKNGQGLILNASNQPALGNWLAANFPCMYGSLAGKSNSVVAALFMTDFNVKGQKTDAQVLAGALAVYFTSSNLGGGTGPAKFGFNISPGGTGAKSYNVGSLGTVLGLQNNTSYTVSQLLQAANAKCPFSSAVANALNTIFSDINQTGDIN